MLTLTPSIKLSLLFLLLVVIFKTHFKISNGYSDLSSNSSKTDAIVKGDCDKNLGNCSEEEEEDSEFEVDSEISRRILNMRRKYISYETLRRDVVPCSTPGSSYYSCGATPANRYRRGCSVIAKCARMY